MTDIFYSSSRNYACVYFSQKEERAGKCGLGQSTLIIITLVFSYFLIGTKLNSKYKFREKKIQNVQVRNPFFLTLHNLTGFLFSTGIRELDFFSTGLNLAIAFSDSTQFHTLN